MSPAVDPEFLLGLVRRLTCVGVLIQSAELLWCRRELRDDGILGWAASVVPTANPLAVLGRWLGQFPGCVYLLTGRALLAAAGLFFADGSGSALVVIGFLCLAQLFFNRRFAVIASEADTMVLVALAAVLAGSLPGTAPALREAALTFLAAHVLIAYGASGVDKAASRRWRSGLQLTVTFLYSLHRLRPLGDWLERHPRAAQAASWGVIALELLFPISVALPPAGFWIFLGSGIVFHATIACTMGLHGFWWAFMAGYPALYFVHSRVAAMLGG
ncbi:MAG: hypothetical protein RLZZ15_3350 [Verrucomicrobiota bacterium]|jgi:hypothetical protein